MGEWTLLQNAKKFSHNYQYINNTKKERKREELVDETDYTDSMLQRGGNTQSSIG